MMKNYSLNLFKLDNWRALNFSYKLVEFNLPFIPGSEDRFNKQLHKIALQVASRSGGPSAIVKRDGKHYVAIPSDNHLDDDTINVVPFNVKISLQKEVHQVSAMTMNDGNMDVVLKFLDFAIRKQLAKNKDLWKLNSSQFFSKKPLMGPNGSTIQIYEGFSYKLVRLYNGDLYICLDLSTKYIDKFFHSHHVNLKNARTLLSAYKGRRFIYLNGDSWYATELVGYGDAIDKHDIQDVNGESISVFNYILKNANGRKQDIQRSLKPTDVTMLYKYPGRTMEPHSGASSLAKMIYSPHDQEVQALHAFSIKDPTTRFESIEYYMKTFFQSISFNGVQLQISKEALVEQIRHFNLPNLKYKNSILDPATAFRDFAYQRKQLLTKNGILNQDNFDDQFLLVPDTMDRGLVNAIQRNLEYQMKKLAPKFAGFSKVIRFPANTNQPATFQIQEIERLLAKQNALTGFALFILPDLTMDSRRYVKSFHDCLKNKFYPNLKVQCASGAKMSSYFESFASTENKSLTEFRVPENKKPKFASYLFNLALEHLNVNRKWPYSLAKNSHYDIYIGIDVHDRHAGFSFFFRNGERILFFPADVPLKNKSTRAEKLKSKLIYDAILPKLKELIPHFCPSPNGIIIVRDGRSFGEEGKALAKIVAELHKLGIVDESKLSTGVLDLHKQSSIPLRVASQTDGHFKLENPRAGAYKIFGDKEAFIYNTGHPFRIRGTAKPLNLSLKEGNVDFLKVVEDIFCQTILAFSAPELSNSLPITIKLIDTLLEPFTEAKIDIEEYEDDDVEELIVEEQ